MFLFLSLSSSFCAEDYLTKFSTTTRNGSGKLSSSPKVPAAPIHQIIEQEKAIPHPQAPTLITFEENGLLSFVQKEKVQKLDETSLNSSSLTLRQELDYINELISLNLEDIKLGLSSKSYEHLINAELITSQHKLSLQTIYIRIQNLQYDLRTLIICYYCKNFANLIYNSCQPNQPKDDHKIWSKKFEIFTLNMKVFTNQLTDMLLKEPKDQPLIQQTQEVITSILIQFYQNSCDFFIHWYTTQRSALTKGIKKTLLGSTTETNFKRLNSNYILDFNFLYTSENSKARLKDMEKSVTDAFEATDTSFTEAVTTAFSWFSWGKKPTIPQDNKSQNGWQ